MFRRYSAKPERLQELIAGNPDKNIVVIDEVQRVPALLNVVHQEIEAKRGIRFALTGSSARKLKRSGVNLLAGRALTRSLHPFMAAELGDRFDFARALQYGTLPLVWDSAHPRDTLKAYVGLYLKEEVQSEGLVRNVGNFARFLEASSFSHASVWNAAEVARQCEVSRKTVVSYLEIMEDLLLGFRIPIFRKRAKRTLSAQPKFYWFDAGVYRSIRPAGLLDRPEEMAGHALEGLVAQHLRAWIDYSGSDAQLYFWRTKAGLEVDFVVYGERGFWAIEVKHASRVSPRDLRGLKSFQEDYPEARPLLLYQGEERLEVSGIPCEPCDAFLRALRPAHPIGS